MNLNRRSWLAGAGCVLGIDLISGGSGSGSSPAAAPTRDTAGDSDKNPRGNTSLQLPARNEFPITQTQTCLNNARWHPLSLGSMHAIQEYLDFKARGSVGPHGSISEMQDRVKVLFAELINARPSEISYVQSTMAGENLVVAGLDIPRGGGNVVTDALHFEGSTYMYRSLERQGLDLRVVTPRKWRIELNDIEKVIDRKTRLVALSLVSFANGFQHDLKAVCDLAHSRGAYVYADIIQAAGAVPIDVRASGVDFCACASYKWLMGDMGLGFLYVKEDLLDKVIRRTQFGHRQVSDFQDHIFPYDPPATSALTWAPVDGAAGRFEVGTISNTTVACLAHSLPYIQKLGVKNIQAHNSSLVARLKKELPRLGLEPLTPAESTSPIVSFALKDGGPIAARLKKANIDVKVEPHLMRISPSVYNDDSDIDRLLNALS